MRRVENQWVEKISLLPLPPRLTPLRYDQRDRITRLGELQYSLDEDGFLRQRGNDLFDYNSNGLLARVYNRLTERGVWYRYDGLGRRVATRTSTGQHMQFFYADLSHPTRVSHLYNHTSNLITSLYYDLQVRTAGQGFISSTALLLQKVEGRRIS